VTSGWPIWGSPRALALYVPLPIQNRLSPYEVSLPRFPFLDRDSVANVQGLASIPTVRLERRLGRLPGDAMTKLKGALAFALDLESAVISAGHLRGPSTRRRWQAEPGRKLRLAESHLPPDLANAAAVLHSPPEHPARNAGV
jgi:mRNA interferase MazF